MHFFAINTQSDISYHATLKKIKFPDTFKNNFLFYLCIKSAWNEYEESDNIYVSNLLTQHSYVIFTESYR